MLKRVDGAVYNALKDGADLAPGFQNLNLAAQGVGVAMDDNNAPLVTADMTKAVDMATAGIISGEIKVENYADNESCSVLQF
jgi:basic membrane protein A